MKMKRKSFIARAAIFMLCMFAGFCSSAAEISDGFGKTSLPDSSEYEGDFKNGKFHGKGTLVWRNGSRYAGEFQDGMMDGAGVYFEKDGTKYEGEFRGGLPHGKGVYAFSSGDVYEGEMRDGAPNGRGVMTFSNGDRYEGEFKNGKFHGKGKYVHINGEGDSISMEGDWEKGEYLDDRPGNFPTHHPEAQRAEGSL